MSIGYTPLPHSNYEEWKSATLGLEIDVDASFGCQCWDYASEFWWNVGFPKLYPQTGPNLAAYECWTDSRIENAGNKFDLVYNLQDVKIGDVVVLNHSASATAGHIAFANQDYQNSNMMELLGQNQPARPEGTAVNIRVMNVSNFLGAFRYKDWNGSIPPSPSSVSKSNFPWVLYAQKLRTRLS